MDNFLQVNLKMFEYWHESMSICLNGEVVYPLGDASYC